MSQSKSELRSALLKAAGRWPVCRPDDGCEICDGRRAVIERVKAEATS